MAQKLFTRERFREVKSMDREQMERFVHEVFDRGYDSGYREGLEQGRSENLSLKRLDLNLLEDNLLKIKGIGAVKAAEIKKIVKEML